jgi:hypothetical protein
MVAKQATMGMQAQRGLFRKYLGLMLKSRGSIFSRVRPLYEQAVGMNKQTNENNGIFS